MKRRKEYDRAVTLLADLRDLNPDTPDFRRRVDALRREHAAKSSFLARLTAAGL